MTFALFMILMTLFGGVTIWIIGVCKIFCVNGKKEYTFTILPKKT